MIRADGAGADFWAAFVEDGKDGALVIFFGRQDLFVLDDRDELHEGGAERFEEVVHGGAVVGVVVMKHGECVEFDFVFFEDFEAAHDIVERSLAALVVAMLVVDFFGAVDGDADEEVVLFEEGAPFVIELGGVCLESVGDGGTRAGVFLLEVDDVLEEVEAHECGFAALPGEVDFFGVEGLSVDVLGDVLLEDGIGHTEVGFAWVEAFFFEVEAVGAIEVADGSDGLGHEMEGPA